jgi:hypothetical protein
MTTHTTVARVRSAEGLPRLPDAAEALGRLLAQRQGAPFAWGSHDCCLWAADAVQAQVGVDPAADLRGRYASGVQAQRVIAAAGGSLYAIARAALGEPLRSPMLACAGDVGLVVGPVVDEDGVRPSLAVCLGEWWAMPSAHGLALRSLDAATVAWRVGCA